jgi:hypothetical protein
MEEVQAFEVDQKVGQASGDPKKVGEHKKEGIWLQSLHFLPKKAYILCSSSV